MNNKKPQTLFIADLHLDVSHPKTVAAFFLFLQTKAKEAEALYILGDLFVVWAGDDDRGILAKQVRIALQQLVVSGTKVFLMSGNRDFLLGKDFAYDSDCILLEDPTVIDLYGRKTLLTHGDLLCGKDALYAKFRALTRDKVRQQMFLSLPFCIRKNAASFVHTLSCIRGLSRSRVDLKNTVQKEALLMMQKFNVDQIIHGHIHMPLIEETNQDGKRMRHIVLGSWEEKEQNIATALFYESNSECEMLSVM
ncbi:MAG: UDP-2,3-diacylglucosamine diphosphatase [Gammaproteobacteria bacterium GWE2_37_16]|nr:MAG: UDP-2,3-diacylglucosamine diphosphatase [Gammaproteobacteria bacterium GWE2_37_16]